MLTTNYNYALSGVTALILFCVFYHIFGENEKKIDKYAGLTLDQRFKNVVESLDDIGFDVKLDKVPFSESSIYNDILNLDQCDFDKTNSEENRINKTSKIISAFHKCINPIVESFNGNAIEMLNNWVKETEKCDDEFKNLKIESLANLDEIKSIIYPKCKEQNIHVTLGIGHDTKAEQRLNMTQPNTKFYGADPIIEPNIRLYSQLGQFFPFAVAREAGVSQFRVLPNQNKTKDYMFQDVTAVDVIYFFKHILKIQRIDTLFLDIEGAEQTFLDHFYKGGKFDQNDITICQFNVELHPIVWKNGYQTTYNVIRQILADKRYIFVRPRPQRPGVFKQFFINVEDDKCIAKYL